MFLLQHKTNVVPPSDFLYVPFDPNQPNSMDLIHSNPLDIRADVSPIIIEQREIKTPPQIEKMLEKEEVAIEQTEEQIDGFES